MTSHALGQHWLREHPDRDDLPHVARMGYRSHKLFGPAWSDRDFCAAFLVAARPDALLLARDHPLSEQKEDMWRNPDGTGKRHADEWRDKVRGGAYHLPVERSYFLGINEPDATDGDRAAIDAYTVAYLDRLRSHGLKGGAFNYSTGHPRTVDGTPNTPPDYSVFEASHQAIVKGGHIGVLHIYGTAAQSCVPGHFDRLRSCPWQDVTWVVGECGIDEHVIGGGPHDGFHVPYAGQLKNYVGWLDALILGVNDPRIHSWQVFTYDFSHPWGTFDVRAIRAALEEYSWIHASVLKPPTTVHLPIVSGPAQPAQPEPATLLRWPVDTGFVSQWYGENPDDYAGFGLRGHNGIDVAVPVGTPVKACASGVVAMTGNDPSYGLYVRLWHKALRCHSFYAHLSAQTVAVGESVEAGQTIGLSGNTGNSTGPHLHFEIRVADAQGNYERIERMGKGAVDPVSFRLGLERGAALAGLSVTQSAASRELAA